MSRSSNTPVCPTSYTPCLLDLSPYCSLFSLTLLQTPLSLSCSSNKSGKLLLKVFLLPVQLFLYLPDSLFKFLKATCPHTHTDKHNLPYCTWFLLWCFSSYFASYYSSTTIPYNSLRFFVYCLISSSRIESPRGEGLCKYTEQCSPI